LDARINGVLFHVYFYLGVFTGVAVLTYFVLAALRTWGLNKNDNLYGTARWATEKDLKRFGLTRRFGVVLGEFQRAKVGYRVNAENSSISLTLKKSAPLACHAGGTNTLLVAPTRSGKGVSSVVPTCLNFPDSMIIFDPKGENYQLTAGFRGKFSHILKFSPLTRETIKFNPLAEIELTDQAFADTGLVLGNMFEEPKGGNDGTSSFFDNNAKDILTGLIIHVLTAVGEDGKRLYPAGKRNMSGVLSILSRAAAERAEGEEGKLAESLMAEMMTARHCDEDMKESETLHSIVRDCASRCKGQNAKVQADVFATVFSKMNLFQDPYIANVTGESDFRLRDFVESELPITLYLTVPFSDITRIAPVFKTLINFMLSKFSRGEATHGEVKLKHRILFLLDEFPVLGSFPFLSKTMGILAGYGMTFFVVVQALNQLVDIYGQNHTFLDNCKTVVVYAPGKVEDAKAFSEAAGKESVTKESFSASGSRFAASLDNMNASSQEVARELINPDELMKLPPDCALIMNQGMPPYIGKKVVYYMDERFKRYAYSEKGGTGYKPAETRTAMLGPLRDAKYGLPSQKGKGIAAEGGGEKRQAAQAEPVVAAAAPIPESATAEEAPGAGLPEKGEAAKGQGEEEASVIGGEDEEVNRLFGEEEAAAGLDWAFEGSGARAGYTRSLPLSAPQE
jgi:type IV secretion system protein VirD4